MHPFSPPTTPPVSAHPTGGQGIVIEVMKRLKASTDPFSDVELMGLMETSAGSQGVKAFLDTPKSHITVRSWCQLFEARYEPNNRFFMLLAPHVARGTSMSSYADVWMAASIQKDMGVIRSIAQHSIDHDALVPLIALGSLEQRRFEDVQTVIDLQVETDSTDLALTLMGVVVCDDVTNEDAQRVLSCWTAAQPKATRLINTLVENEIIMPPVLGHLVSSDGLKPLSAERLFPVLTDHLRLRCHEVLRAQPPHTHNAPVLNAWAQARAIAQEITPRPDFPSKPTRM